MPRSKPSVYPDTNIFSVMHYHGANTFLLARRTATRDWWDLERKYFHLVSSDLTEDELADGVYPGQAQAIAMVKRLPYLVRSGIVKQGTADYISNGIVPANKVGDAAQLAFCSIYRVDYLLTWNQAHLANAEILKKLNAMNSRNGWRTPLIVTPETIPRHSMGQEIRRRDEG